MREQLRRHRFRFRLAHELAHTLFFWRRGGRPQRHLLDSASQERFCDTFSRALLVPPDVAKRLPIRSDAVVYLQEAFDVSLEVAARALAIAHPSAFIGLWFASADGQLQLQWASDAGWSATLGRYGCGPPLAELGDWLPARRQLVICLPRAPRS